ncbi:MAG: M20/M25/M40 family metallo-hydrolase [Vicinamibacterales bacterium]
MWPRLVTVVLVWFVGALAPAPTVPLPAAIDHAIQQVTAAELREHISVLASDRLAGRGLGHEGNKEAEVYIAGVLRNAKVLPVLPNYLQRVDVYSPRLGPAASLTISGIDKPIVELRVGSDFLPQPESGEGTANGVLVFVQHGISAPALGHDDYANLDARGAVVLALDGAPEPLLRSSQLSAEDKADIGAMDRKADDARAHGAVGLIVIRSYIGDAEGLWPAHPSVRSAEYRLYGPMHEKPLAVAVMSERAAKPVREAIEQRQVLTATLNPDVVVHPVVMDNILGMVEGQTPADVVVVGAHLDHDGIDDAGRIYNGADDNASGTAAVLAMAAAFTRAAAQGTRPARAVVFALWNGEEKGSLGAEYYVSHPQPARRIVANINLDMVGRDEDIPDPDDPRYRGFARTRASDNTNVVHLLGYTYAPDLARAAEIANETIHLTVKQDYDRDSQGLVRRSDDWPFLQHGIPAVFLTTGLHPDYHTPSDDTARIDFAKLERITELASRLVWLAANGDAPRFHAQ